MHIWTLSVILLQGFRRLSDAELFLAGAGVQLLGRLRLRLRLRLLLLVLKIIAVFTKYCRKFDIFYILRLQFYVTAIFEASEAENKLKV